MPKEINEREIRKALGNLFGSSNLILSNPYFQMGLRLRRMSPPTPSGSFTPYSQMIGEFLSVAQSAATVLGELDVKSPPRTMIGLRPLFTGLRTLEDFEFDWELMEKATCYKVRLFDPSGIELLKTTAIAPPLKWSVRHLLEPEKRYDWLVAGVDKEGTVVGTWRGTFWILSESMLNRLAAEEERLRKEGLDIPWAADLHAQFGLYDEALRDYLRLINAEDRKKREWGYIGAIYIWRIIFRELLARGRTRLAAMVDEELCRLQAQLRSVLGMA